MASGRESILRITRGCRHYPVFLIVMIVMVTGGSSVPAEAEMIQAISQAERQSLIDLYNATDGDNWTNNTGWKENFSFAPYGSECDWYGVTCVQHVQGDVIIDGPVFSVTRISLPGNNLVGNLPQTLFWGDAFWHLQELNLYNNSLSGNVPSLANTRLRVLNLSGNSLSGELPLWLAEMGPGERGTGYEDLTAPYSGIANISLSSNEFSGTIPPWLENLSGLVSLSLDGNGLTGSIPPELGSLELQYLRLGDNQLSGEIPAELANMASLRDLGLSGNRLTGPIPSNLSSTELTTLDLRQNQLSGTIPEQLATLPALRYLQLGGNMLTGPIPSALTSLDLYSLDLSYNALFTDDETVQAWADREDSDWANTQTMPPSNELMITTGSGTRAAVYWIPVAFQQFDGGYDLQVAPSSAGPWTEGSSIEGKKSSRLGVENLSGDAIFLRVRTYTDPHQYNQNRLYSRFSDPVQVALHHDSLSFPPVGETAVWFEGDRPESFVTTAFVGDFNGDGAVDYVVPVQFSVSPLRYGAWLYAGTAEGRSSAPANLLGWELGGGFGTAQLGSGAVVADFNDDGFDDIVVSVRGYTDGELGEGAVAFYYGSPDGLGEPSVMEGNAIHAHFGDGVLAGDFNGDGFPDLIVIQSNQYSSSVTGSSLYLFEGSAAGLSTPAEPFLTGLSFYTRVTVIDINGDGYDDLVNSKDQLVYHGSDAGLGPGTASEEAVASSWGDVNGDGRKDRMLRSEALDGTYLTLEIGSESGYRAAAGWQWAGAGLPGSIILEDLNGDGLDDILIPLPHKYVGPSDSGEYLYQGMVQIHYGAEDADIISPFHEPDVTLTDGDAPQPSGTPTSQFGSSLTVTTVNGDTSPDLLIGARQYSGPESNEGAVFLLLGESSTVSGDANGDESVTVADIFYLINHLFAGGADPTGSGDANGDGSVTVADIFYLINHLFAGGPPPVASGTSPVETSESSVALDYGARQRVGPETWRIPVRVQEDEVEVSGITVHLELGREVRSAVVEPAGAAAVAPVLLEIAPSSSSSVSYISAFTSPIPLRSGDVIAYADVTLRPGASLFAEVLEDAVRADPAKSVVMVAKTRGRPVPSIENDSGAGAGGLEFRND